MNGLTKQTDFDYSLVGAVTASKLKSLSNQLDGIYQNYQVVVGEVLYQAQQELSSYGDGVFGQWVESKGISKRNCYNYINAYKFVQNLHEPMKEIFERTPKSLQFEMSKPSALAEVNDAVFSGDITTHKEYKELERKLKQAEIELSEKTVQNERLAEIALKKSEPQVVEKEVIVEKIPDDYESSKALAEASKRNEEFYKNQNAELREEMRELERLIKDKDSLLLSQSELQALKERKSKLDSLSIFRDSVDAFLHSSGALIYSEQFASAFSEKEITLSIIENVSRIEKWLSDIKAILPTGEIIEEQ